MRELIALVATAVVVDGERIVIQPGQALPTLSSHDAQALVQSGAAQDRAADVQAARAAQAEADQAGAAYQAEREAVQAEAASTAQTAPAPARETKGKARA